MNHAFQYPCACTDSSHIDSELGHVTYFGQWDISKHDAGKGSINAYALEFAFLEPLDYHAEWRPG